MSKNFNVVLLGALAVLCVMGGTSASSAASQDFQKTPIVLLASEALPRSLLVGSNYRIKEAVVNDGMVNTYELDTLYGPVKVESTALLIKRIGELNALAKIEEIKKTNVYLKALQGAAMSPVNTAVGLVENPVGTVEGIGSGIGRFFSNIGSAVTGGGSPYKDNVANSLLGQASYKREYAHQFNVDPYTPYEPLQKALNDLSWTATAGGLTVKAALAAIPGAAVAVVSYTGTAGSLKALVNEKTPNELAKINTDRLYGMGVPVPVVNIFMQNTYFDPYEQTLLVGYLASMAGSGVGNCKAYVGTAAAAMEESVAVFLRVRAQLMGLYSEKERSAASFVDANGVPMLLTKNGVVVGIFPLDHVAWTAGFAQKLVAVSSAIKEMQGVTGKELWITGTVDPVARRFLENSGWKVQDKYQEQILTKLGY
jgi:hypothetical protein